MSNKRLIIGGNEIELGEATIATSYALADVQDVTTRKFDHSNRFKVPLTPQNIKALGFAHLEKSESSIPYERQDAQLLDSGVNIMPSSKATVESASGGFNIELYGGAKEFFEALGDKTLTDLPKDNDTDDYYVGHDGMFEAAYFADTAVNEAATPLLANSQKLVMKYNKVVDKIIASAGYAKSGSVFAEPSLLNLAYWPLGNKGVYNQKFIDEKLVDARNVGGQIALTNVYQNIQFTNVVKNEGGYFNGTDTYTQSKPIAAYANKWYRTRFISVIRVESSNSPTGGVAALEMRIINNGGVYAGTLVAAIGFFPQTYILQGGFIDAGNNETTTVQIRCNAGTLNVVLGVETRFYNEVESTDPAIGVYKQALGLYPEDIKQKDFMKDFAIRYGVLFREKDKTLYARTWKEIVNGKATAKDWTHKRDYSVKDAIKYDYAGKYAQANYFKYKTEDDGVGDIVGRGNLPVPNINLELTKDYYTSLFTNTNTRAFGNVTAGYITCAVVTQATPNDSALRLFMLRNKSASEPNLTGPIAVYRVAYFEDSTQAYDCSYTSFLNLFYSELIRSLNKAKLVDRKYILNIIDVNQLDLFHLVYDSGSYFLVNKVSNYISDKPAAVQLFKVV
jgi:hypothetical protein